jgi:hypothetical protein
MENHLNLDKTRPNNHKGTNSLKSLKVIDESNIERNILQSHDFQREKSSNLLEDSLDQFRPFSAVVTDNFDFSIKDNTIDYRKNKNTYKKNDISNTEGGNIYNPINDLNNDDSFIAQRNHKKFLLADTPE